MHLPILDQGNVSTKEIYGFLKTMNKKISKNPKIDVGDETLNKMRSYIISAAPPSYSLKLLQKKREDRNADKEFQTQLEEIIKKAAKLDEETSQYFQEQEEMKNDVKQNESKITELAHIKTRAAKDSLELEKQIDQKKNDKIYLQLIAKELKNIQSIIDKGIKKYQSCEKYIHEVVASTDEFDKRVENLISRYNTLKTNVNELKKQVI